MLTKQIATLVLASAATYAATGATAKAVLTKNRELIFYYDTKSHSDQGKTFSVPNGATQVSDIPWAGSFNNYDVVVFDATFAKCGTKYNTAYWFNYKAPMTSIDLPPCVNVIGVSSFSQSPKLETVTIPASVTELKAWAFNPCDGLKSITFAATKPPAFNKDSIKGAATGCTIHVPMGADRNEWEAALGENLARVILDIPEPPKPGLVLFIR